MNIQAIKTIEDVSYSVLVINMFEGETTTQELVNKFVIEKDNFEGKFGTTYVLSTLGQEKFDKILVVGFGKKEDFCADKLRQATAKAIKKLQQIKAKSACFDFSVSEDFGEYAALGVGIANYAFDKYKSEKSDKVETLYFTNFSTETLKKGEIIASAMEFARDLANEPAAIATPTKLAQIAQDLNGIETRIYNKDEIKAMNMGAFLAVGQGSTEEPKFIHMKYSNPNAKKKIALIGKGICFDSGGLDIKPAASMLTMKDDMSGAAAVLGIMSKITELNPEIELHAIIAACENMPSGSSYKPGDILTAKNGKTIEVDNTDAEGRLTLADALCYACELGVDEVVDIATLTGACVVALGSTISGILGNDKDLISELINSGKNYGEKLWEMPLDKDYFDSLKSSVADMKNTGSRMGGASIAAIFLNEFVSKDVKWAHIDIAGTAYLEKGHKEFISGSTGAGVRTLLGYICK